LAQPNMPQHMMGTFQPVTGSPAMMGKKIVEIV